MKTFPLAAALGLLASSAGFAQKPMKIFHRFPLAKVVTQGEDLYALDTSGNVHELVQHRFAFRPTALPAEAKIHDLVAGKRGIYAIDASGRALLLRGKNWAPLFDPAQTGERAAKVVPTPKGWAVLTHQKNLFLGGKAGNEALCQSQSCDLIDISEAGPRLWLLGPGGKIGSLMVESKSYEPLVQTPNLAHSDPANKPTGGGVPDGLRLVGSHADQDWDLEVYTLTNSGDIVRGLDVSTAGLDMRRRIATGLDARTLTLGKMYLYVSTKEGRVLRFERGLLFPHALDEAATLQTWEAIEGVQGATQILLGLDRLLFLKADGTLWRKNLEPVDRAAYEARIKEKLRLLHGGV